MTRRTQTHIIDTLAIREIMSKLPENWLVRGLEERDYGVDLSIELYDGENPTGCFSLIQVKGTAKSFSGLNSVSLSNFPSKTLKYAELFPEAFFIFHTSTVDKITYFTWAQKYIELRLKNDNSSWRDQDSNTIHFPDSNILGSVNGDRKIESIMKRLSGQQEGLRFLTDYERLKYNWKNFSPQQTEVYDLFLEITEKLKAYKGFYALYEYGVTKSDLHALTVAFKDLKYSPIILNSDCSMKEDDAERCLFIDSQLFELGLIKHFFLNQHELDNVAEEHSDSPY